MGAAWCCSWRSCSFSCFCCACFSCSRSFFVFFLITGVGGALSAVPSFLCFPSRLWARAERRGGGGAWTCGLASSCMLVGEGWWQWEMVSVLGREGVSEARRGGGG